MKNQLDVVAAAYRVLVDESRIPVHAEAVLAASQSKDPAAPTPWPTLRAMARAVNDPHTILVSPASAAQMQALVTGRSVRCPGFTLHGIMGGAFVVGEVVPGGPAALAKLEPGDVLVSIDGTAVTRGFEELVDLMGKPDGSCAELRVRRREATLNLQLILTAGLLPLVTCSFLAPGVGYVRLRFVTTSNVPDRDSATLVRRGLEQLVAHGLEGVVLDLRSNPGGYGVTRVASVLTDRDPIALYRDAHGNEERAGRTGDAPACSCPIVVLVDDQTLSSAEMITLALQDHGVARVVGQPTAGGLTVPRYVPLDAGYILMTPERFAVGPRSGRALEGFRVQPDVVVPNRTPEDCAAGRDPQLETALELLERE